ncbi:MAG: DNA-binding protein [Hyphomicrobiales bacterium]|nr:DNA-binding protein [Hyphomicrobiales bacterium]
MTRDGNRAASAADKKLGGRIRIRRRELDISQTSLGEQIGVSFRQVQKYEAGLNRISITRLEQIAAALDMPVTEFLTPQPHAQAALAPAPLETGTLEAFLRLPEARTLVEAFSAIPDPKTRQQIADLVGTMSRLGPPRDGKRSDADE